MENNQYFPKFILPTIFKNLTLVSKSYTEPQLFHWSAFPSQIEVMPSFWLLTKNPDSLLFAELALNSGPHTTQLYTLLPTDMYCSFKAPLCFSYPVSHSTPQLHLKQNFPSPLCTVCTTVNIYYTTSWPYLLIVSFYQNDSCEGRLRSVLLLVV